MILQPFDIKEAKEGATIITKNGCAVKIIEWNRSGDLPIIALARDSYGNDILLECNESGEAYKNEVRKEEYTLMLITKEINKDLKIISSYLRGIRNGYYDEDYNSSGLLITAEKIFETILPKWKKSEFPAGINEPELVKHTDLQGKETIYLVFDGKMVDINKILRLCSIQENS